MFQKVFHQLFKQSEQIQTKKGIIYFIDHELRKKNHSKLRIRVKKLIPFNTFISNNNKFKQPQLVLEQNNFKQLVGFLMQQPQSSSTLQNYISSGQNPDSSRIQNNTSSQCVQCQHISKMQQHQVSQSQSGSSSGDDGELVRPLHKHIIEHSRQIEQTIMNLQRQIQKLKKANQSKDVMIDQLKSELKHVQMSQISNKMQQQNEKEAEFIRRQKQIDRIRQEMYLNSQNLMNPPFNGDVVTKNTNVVVDEGSLRELKERMKNIEVKFEDRSSVKAGKGKNGEKIEIEQNGQRKISYVHKIEVRGSTSSEYSDSDRQDNLQKLKSKKTKQKPSPAQSIKRPPKPSQSPVANQTNQANQPANRPPSSSHQATSYPPTYTELPTSKANIEQQLINHQQNIERLQKHILFCQEEMLWMTNFIIAFLKMSERFMGMFKEPVLREHWSMKKKTKIAWRYVKHVMAYLVSQ